MTPIRPPSEIGEILDRVDEAAADSDRVTIAAMLESVGRRSFGPLLLVPGLIALSPLSGIPGVPTMVGLMVLLITGQFLLGRRYFWLPRWVLKRSASRSKIDRALRVMRPVAGWVDRLTRPRITVLTRDVPLRAIALVCMLTAGAMPFLEFVPFAASIVGAALTAFGLALTAQDGLLALVALVLWIGGAVVVVQPLL